ncbi:MAG: hypothetical protein MZV64_28910 [Ignavibacteriales bacterium]|nr:hypothetical protein [Ignavibacteriales bacterium]
MRSMISSVTAWIEAARSMSRWRERRSRAARGGPPNSRVELLVGHGQARCSSRSTPGSAGTSRPP